MQVDKPAQSCSDYRPPPPPPHKIPVCLLNREFSIPVSAESSLRLRLDCFAATASPETEPAGPDEEEDEEEVQAEEGHQDVQAVVLVPGELVGVDP